MLNKLYGNIVPEVDDIKSWKADAVGVIYLAFSTTSTME